MEKNVLSAAKRIVSGRKVKKLRKDGIIPANLYGKKIKSESIQMSPKDFKVLYDRVGESSVVELTIDKKVHPVLIHNVQYHPVTNDPIHVDFYQVDLKEKVAAKVPVVMIGESLAVKDKLGVLLTLINEVEVEALPTDLPEKIEVDISKLKAVNEAIKVKDLSVSPKVKILTSHDQDVVKIAPLVSKEAEKLAKEEAEAKAAAAAAVPSQEGKTETKEGEGQPVSAPANQPAASSPSAKPAK